MSQIYKNSEGNYYKLPENHPVVSIIYLLLWVFLGMMLFMGISMGVGIALYGPSLIENIPAIMSGVDVEKIGFLKIFQILTSIGAFIVPCFLLQVIEKRRTTYFNFSLPPHSITLLLAALIMIVSIPLLELSILINLKMQLPDFLAGVETWMRQKEQEMERITNLLMNTTTYKGLFVNLFMIAVLPAIGEELLFRGVLQKIFFRWSKNPHVAIWIVAIIFSAFHLQFYGFLPRMLMGALFGYLYYWGRSIWLPILAHFINNAYATLFTFILLRQGHSMEEITEAEPSGYWIYLLSFVGTVVLIQYFWKIYKRDEPLLTYD